MGAVLRASVGMMGAVRGASVGVMETFTVDDIVDQFQRHYGGGDGDDAFSLRSFVDNEPYTASGYVPLRERQRWLQLMKDKEGKELVVNALTDWMRKSFAMKEERLKDWYQNGRWIEDERYKIDHSFIPRSHYVVVLVMYAVLGR